MHACQNFIYENYYYFNEQHQHTKKNIRILLIVIVSNFFLFSDNYNFLVNVNYFDIFSEIFNDFDVNLIFF